MGTACLPIGYICDFQFGAFDRRSPPCGCIPQFPEVVLVQFQLASHIPMCSRSFGRHLNTRRVLPSSLACQESQPCRFSTEAEGAHCCWLPFGSGCLQRLLFSRRCSDAVCFSTVSGASSPRIVNKFLKKGDYVHVSTACAIHVICNTSLCTSSQS